jgi:DNA-binding NtrC family response regulator
MKTVLIIDDDPAVRESLSMILEYAHYNVEFAENGERGLTALNNAPVDVVLLDVQMAGIDGLEVLQRIRERFEFLPVIMISGHGTIETAVEATKRGAYDFLPKPLDRDKLLITIRNALQTSNITREYNKLSATVEEKRRILGNSQAIKNVLSLIERAAPTDARILITGENGSGKELVARAIHKQSKRSDRPFIEVNCAAIPAELIESELFGHERGAFTGASSQHIGKFEQADSGTIFLDEIGDMSLNAQAKVLRTLEEGNIERVGGHRLITVDVRVIAATNKNLEEEIVKGNFRSDFYHRLNVIQIRVPALREHKEDIPMLVEEFIQDVCQRNGFSQKIISKEALQIVIEREWRGNVRELKNTIERLVILSTGNNINITLLESEPSAKESPLTKVFESAQTFQEFKDSTEAMFIEHKLNQNEWNISKTAEALGIQRSHLYSKIQKFGLYRKNDKDASKT